jgi:AraC-like DNA-binding protein
MVKFELNKLGLFFLSVDLGVAELYDTITPEQRIELANNLKKSGLELLDDKHSSIVDKIKTAVNELIYDADKETKVNFSEYLTLTLGYEYSFLSNIFSEVQGITIQQYIIFNKVERVKEMLMYEHISLTDIAFSLNYSSVAHLSAQFKKTTGLTPTFFKTIAKQRTSISRSFSIDEIWTQ